ncbi:hypothetical protein [Parendozoicomonas haliclonae]|uniref:Uncharacterized protein n=1 Tax=Parendozoicomonas haliclonae TaxID=1960125 RepID=A0A1X7AQ71_9GAMM|nr:hypothetical protein [Parendozoicomonas haliclonae]SMA49551.1 hypothetical protein EHSB41UT_03339 [Parendozoicomonas haliclonae]
MGKVPGFSGHRVGSNPQNNRPKAARKQARGKSGSRQVRGHSSHKGHSHKAHSRESRYYTRSSNYTKVEVVSPPQHRLVQSDLNGWMSDLVNADNEVPPRFIPERLGSSGEHIPLEQLPKVPSPTTETAPALQLSKSYEGYLNQLDGLKDQLGGAPNHDGKRPVLNRDKVFWGRSVQHVRLLISRAINGKWFPPVLWKALGKHFHIKNGLTHYEYLSLAIQSISQMKKHMDEIKFRLQEGKNPADYFHEVTGLTFHKSYLPPQMLGNLLENYVEVFELQFEKAVAGGRLQEFLEQAMPFRDVCFEARYRSMASYVGAQSEGSDALNTELVVDYDSQSPVEQVFSEEIRKFFVEHGPENMNREAIREHLINQGVIGKVFAGGLIDSDTYAAYLGQEKESKDIEITEEVLDQYLEFAENELYLF